MMYVCCFFFFFQAEDGIRDLTVTGVQTCALPICSRATTGVPGLDEVVNGGYFLGSTTVVAGISGVGKSVMALQYIAEGARLGEPSLMLTLDEQIPQVLRNAKSIGIDLQTHIDRGGVQ